jgi:hypothetical protein
MRSGSFLIVVVVVTGCASGEARQEATPGEALSVSSSTNTVPAPEEAEPEVAKPAPPVEKAPTITPVAEHPRKALREWTAVLPPCAWTFGMVKEYEEGKTAERWVCKAPGIRSAVFELVGKEPAKWRNKDAQPTDPDAEVRLLDLGVPARNLKPKHIRMLAEMTGISDQETERLQGLVSKALQSGPANGEAEAMGTMVGPGGEARLTVFHFGEPEFGASFKSRGRQ